MDRAGRIKASVCQHQSIASRPKGYLLLYCTYKALGAMGLSSQLSGGRPYIGASKRGCT